MPELKGIIPNSFAHIFGHIAKSGDDKNFLVRVSYLEIYNEEVRDLLGKKQDQRSSKVCHLWTSIEKIPKISASGRNFLDPLPPSLKKGPTDKNVGISYLIIKFSFFEISTPPPNSPESRTSPIFTIEVAPY